MNTRIVLIADGIEQQVIEFQGDNLINFDFQSIDTDGSRQYNRFCLRPQEIVNAISSYLNSVPSQQMINKEVGQPSSIMENKTTLDE